MSGPAGRHFPGEARRPVRNHPPRVIEGANRMSEQTTAPKPPISPARLAANRRNAMLSTGPRTPEGKQRSKMNGLVHGCRSDQLIIPGEDPAAFERRRDTWTV